MLALIFLLPLLAAASPIDARDAAAFPDPCNGAINCESFFNNVTNRLDIRFKPGMDPNSEWFKRTVPTYDDEDTVIKVRMLDDPLEARSNEFKTSLAHSAERLQWGTLTPSDTLHSAILNHCPGGGCDIGPYNYPTKYTSQTDQFPAPYTLSIKFDDAIWPIANAAAYKTNFANAVEKMAAKLQKQVTKKLIQCTTAPHAPPVCASKMATFHTSGKFFEVQRHHVSTNALEGFIRISATMKESADSDACTFVTQALGIAFSEVDGIGSLAGGFFGLIGSKACTNG